MKDIVIKKNGSDMLSIKGNQICVLEEAAIDFVTIFDLNGTCVFAGEVSEEKYTFSSSKTNANFLVIVNLRSRAAKVIRLGMLKNQLAKGAQGDQTGAYFSYVCYAEPSRSKDLVVRSGTNR